MHHYELVVVLSPMLNQEQVSDTWDRIKTFISNRNGDITYEEKWGTRRLAYPIRKGPHQFLEGSYHLTRFNTDTSFNIELNTFLKLDEQVLRSLVVAAKPPGVEPETPLQTREAAAQVAAARAAIAEAEAAAAAAAEPAAEEGAEEEAEADPSDEEVAEVLTEEASVVESKEAVEVEAVEESIAENPVEETADADALEEGEAEAVAESESEEAGDDSAPDTDPEPEGS